MMYPRVVIRGVVIGCCVLVITSSYLSESASDDDTDSKQHTAQDTNSAPSSEVTSNQRSSEIVQPSQIRNRRSDAFLNDEQFSGNDAGINSAFLYNDQIMQNLFNSQAPRPLNYARSQLFLNLLRPRTTRLNTWDDHSLMHFGKRSVGNDNDDENNNGYPEENIRTRRSADFQNSEDDAHFDETAVDKNIEISHSSEFPNFGTETVHDFSNVVDDNYLQKPDSHTPINDMDKKSQDKWHNMMNFGKRSENAWNHDRLHFGKKDDHWHNVMSFGKKSDLSHNFDEGSDSPWEHDTLHFGKKAEPWHNTMNFGKRSESPWEHDTLHFGKKSELWNNKMNFGKRLENPWEHDTIHFGKKSEPWHNMMNFGKRTGSPWEHDTLHFGKKAEPWHNMMNFGKRSENPWDHSSTLHFGKKEYPWHNTLNFGKKSDNSDGNDTQITDKRSDPWHNMMNFGKKSDDYDGNVAFSFDKREDPWHNTMSFGKKYDNFWDQRALYFNKKGEPWHNKMSFGKKSDNSWDHSTLHFGKKDEPWHSMLNFGKRQDEVVNDEFDSNMNQWKEDKKSNPWDHSTLHFGKRSNSTEDLNSLMMLNANEENSDPEKVNVLNKRSIDAWENHNVLHFGKRDPWGSHNTMHFGKREPWGSHNTMHFGKREPWEYNSAMHFGKRSQSNFSPPERSDFPQINLDKTAENELNNKEAISKNKESIQTDSELKHIIEKRSKKSVPIVENKFKTKISEISSPLNKIIEKQGTVTLQNDISKHKDFTTTIDNKNNFQETVIKGDGLNAKQNSYTKRALKSISSDEVKINPSLVQADQLADTKIKVPKSEADIFYKSRIEKRAVEATESQNKKQETQSPDNKSQYYANRVSKAVLHLGKRSLDDIDAEGNDALDALNGPDKRYSYNDHDTLYFGKRAPFDHNTMHFGKRYPFDHDTLHFGKRGPFDHDKMYFGKRDPFSHDTMHFGKRELFDHDKMYFGKRDPFGHDTMHFGKRELFDHDKMYFGKRDPFGHDTMHFGKRELFDHDKMYFGKRDPFGHDTMHFGKRELFDHDKMYFGKREPFGHDTMHFGKREPWEHSTLHFGKRDPFGHDTMHFGKRSPWDHNTIHFGKRSDSEEDQDESSLQNGSFSDYSREDIDVEIQQLLKELSSKLSVPNLSQNQHFLNGLESLENSVMNQLRDKNLPLSFKIGLLREYLKPILRNILNEQHNDESEVNGIPDGSESRDEEKSVDDAAVDSSLSTNDISLIENGLSEENDVYEPQNTNWIPYMSDTKSKRNVYGKSELKRYFVPFQGARSIVYPHAWFASQIRRSAMPRSKEPSRSFEFRMAEKKEDPFNAYMHFG